jgi:hypothetical protein
MRQVPKRIATIALVCLLAACSGGSKITPPVATKPTTVGPTTVPPPPSGKTIAAVKKYLAGPGAPLLKFERATANLSAGTAPTRAACIKYKGSTLPKITKGPNTLIGIGASAPDPALGPAFRDDIARKFVVILACAGTTRPLPDGAMDPIVSAYSKLKARLALSGINI